MRLRARKIFECRWTAVRCQQQHLHHDRPPPAAPRPTPGPPSQDSVSTAGSSTSLFNVSDRGGNVLLRHVTYT